MKNEFTLSIVKPDAVMEHHIGDIISKIEEEGFRVVALRMSHLSKKEAESFYEIHKARPFFAELVDFMISGPVVVMVLEAPNAIEKLRGLMGCTDPEKAENGTIRSMYGQSVGKNAIHGSDGPDTAKREIGFFFKQQEIFA